MIDLDGKEVTMILVKNPVGLDQVLEMIKTDDKPFSLAVLLNANYADGIDTSWIWDGDFENLPFDKIPSVLTGGERYKDITFRLRVAGVPEENFARRESLKRRLSLPQNDADRTHLRTSNIHCRLTITETFGR